MAWREGNWWRRDDSGADKNVYPTEKNGARLALLRTWVRTESFAGRTALYRRLVAGEICQRLGLHPPSPDFATPPALRLEVLGKPQVEELTSHGQILCHWNELNWRDSREIPGKDRVAGRGWEGMDLNGADLSKSLRGARCRQQMNTEARRHRGTEKGFCAWNLLARIPSFRLSAVAL